MRLRTTIALIAGLVSLETTFGHGKISRMKLNISELSFVHDLKAFLRK
jgi:hypothetical protein